MKNQAPSSAALRKRRHQLVRSLPPIEQIVRGSLMETYKRCGRPNCHCAGGPGHGPKRYLSTIARTGERPRLGYDKAIAAQWRWRIERARYDADLAERRYEAVDPGNRLIAATLEQRWNDAMQRLLELEAELTNFERQTLRRSSLRGTAQRKAFEATAQQKCN